MIDIVSAVKHDLRISYAERSVDALQRAYELLQKSEKANTFNVLPSLNMHNELYILCCEAAINLNQWDLAESSVKAFVGRRAPTKSLDARALYCTGLVGFHKITSTHCSKTRVAEHLRSATMIITGIKIALEDWPREAYTVARGVEHLWMVIRDIFHQGTYENVLDILFFVLALHEKLMLGGPFAQLQWATRCAICLRGVGRHAEGVSQLSAVLDLVSKVGSERLQLQFFRLQIGLGVCISSGRSKQDYTRPVLQALYAVQLFFSGVVDENTSKAELIAAHERLISDPEKKDVKTKSKKTTELEPALSDPILVLDVLSEVVLGLAMCGVDDICSASLPKLLQSNNLRARLFGEFAQAVLVACKHGALGTVSFTDASYLTKSLVDVLFNCIKTVENAMESVHMIADASERLYTLQTGCVILWNLSLPLLQPETRGKLYHTFKRLLLYLSEHGFNMQTFLVRVAYELCLIEFDEDNINSVLGLVDRTLSLDCFSTSVKGNIGSNMDFQFLWLKRRAMVRKAIDCSAFSSLEDQAIYCIEQARTSSSKSCQLVLLQNAVEKLPPLCQILNPSAITMEKQASPCERGKSYKHKKQQRASVTIEEQQPRMITNILAAKIYYFLLEVAKTVESSTVYPIIEKVSTCLTNIDSYDKNYYKELLIMKAEAHLSIAELLSKPGKTTTDAKSNSTADAMAHISAAAKISVELVAAGYHEEWIAINACLLLIKWSNECFKKGYFLFAKVALGELYNALNQLQLDPIREQKLFSDIGFGYVMSILQEYIASKGEVDGELSSLNLGETMEKTFMYPICEPNNPLLRHAADVCRDVMNKWRLPSYRKNLSMLNVCIHRLLERNPEELHHPQEQLLFHIARLNSPMMVTEKQALLNKACMELLRTDPSVELCGRLVHHSMQFPENERITLELCRIADQLYHDGKLGWGTKSLILTNTNKEKAQMSNQASLPSVNVNAAGEYPKPTEEDWFWYSDILLNHATVLMRLGAGVKKSKRIDLDKRILVSITNSAIAASHGPEATRVFQIINAYQTYCCTSDSFCLSQRSLFLPSLRILLSESLLSKLLNLRQAGGQNNVINAEFECLYPLLITMGKKFFAALLGEGAHEEGLKAINRLFLLLPQKYHTVFRTFEAQFSTSLGVSTKELIRKIKGCDPETGAAVWIAIAKNAATIPESKKCWMKAFDILACKPLQKAEMMIQMAEWMAGRNAVSRDELTTMLLSALDLIERFEDQSLVIESNSGSLGQGAEHLADYFLKRSTFYMSNFTCSQSDGSSTGGKTRRELPSLHEVMIAIRILYLLFVLASEKPHNKKNFASSKRSCASTILHYVYCLWFIVSAHVRRQIDEGTDGSKLKLLELPEDFHGWWGFTVDPQHVETIRILCVDDAVQNTENIWGMLFEVCEFFMEESWEHFVFMILSWIEFAAKWRYGVSDPHTVAVVRAINYKSFLAAVQSGWGRSGCMFNVEPPTAEYMSNVQELLLSADNLTSNSFLSDRFLYFKNFGGVTCYCVLKEAEELFVLGRLQESLEWSEKVLSCALHIGMRDVVVRCYLLRARVNILRGNCAHAANELCRIGKEFDSSLSFSLWTELCIVRFQALIGCQQVEEAISVANQLPQAFSLRVTGIADGCVAKEIADDVLMTCKRRMLRECAKSLSDLFSLSIYRFCWPRKSKDAAREYLENAINGLMEFNDWQSLLVALHVKQTIRPTIDELLLKINIEETKTLLQKLYIEYCDILKLTELIHEEMTVMVPISMYVKDIGLYPSIAMALEKVLVMRTRNCLDRNMLKRFLLVQYNKLTMEQLGIPTGGPKELESAVLCYMRNHTLYEEIGTSAIFNVNKKIDEQFLNAESQFVTEENRTMTDKEKEESDVKCATNHFGIPLEHLNGVCGADVEAMLLRVMNTDGSCSPTRVKAISYAFLTEFFRRLSDFSKVEKCAEPKLVAETNIEEILLRENYTLTTKWALQSCAPEKERTQRSNRRQPSVGSRNPKKSLRSMTDISTSLILQGQKQEDDGNFSNFWAIEGDSLQSVIMLCVAQARRLLDYKQMAECYVCLAHTFILSGMPCAAGAAVEFAQAAQMCSFITDIYGALIQSSPESILFRLVERMKYTTPFLLNTYAFDAVREALLNTSNMFKRFDIVGDWPADANTAKSLPSDYCTFTVVREGDTSYVLVALRFSSGEVYCRRVLLDIESMLECGEEIERLRQLKKSEIVKKTSMDNNSSYLDGLSIPDIQFFLERLEYLASPLWTDFTDIMNLQASKSHIFLCLDPIFHSLPFERISVFTQFMSVQREMSVPHIRQKLLSRGGKLSLGGTIFVVDPFGEHEASSQVFMGLGNRIKAPSSEFLSFVKDKSGTVCKVSALALRRALTSINYSTILIDKCGPFTEILSPQTLVELNLDHLLMGLIVEGTNDISLRREEKQRTSKTPLSLLYERQSVVSLLLLARGVHYFCINVFLPLTPEEGDAVCKHSLSVVTSCNGKHFHESVCVGTGDVEDTHSSAFFFYGVPPAGKQK